MKERSIILTQTEVLAILAGNQSQLRRPIEPQPEFDGTRWSWPSQKLKALRAQWGDIVKQPESMKRWCPIGIGNRLHGLESFAIEEFKKNVSLGKLTERRIVWRADKQAQWLDARYQLTGGPFYLPSGHKSKNWIPANQMPPTVARLFLEATAIQAEQKDDQWQWVVDFKRVEA